MTEYHWALVVKPLSADFVVGYEYKFIQVNERGDFHLLDSRGFAHVFGFAYKSHIRLTDGGQAAAVTISDLSENDIIEVHQFFQERYDDLRSEAVKRIARIFGVKI